MRRLITSLLLVHAFVLVQHARADDLGARLQPFIDCLNGTNTDFAITVDGSVAFDGKQQAVKIELSRAGDKAMSLALEHPDYGFRLDRDDRTTRLYLPKHKAAIVGGGDEPSNDSLAPEGLASQLI